MRTVIAKLSCLLLLSSIAAFAADQATITYEISLKDPASHYATVRVSLPAGSSGRVQLPVWNATYQVRDFARNISEIKAGDIEARAIDKSTWQAAQANASTWTYRIYLADPGPFGAEVNEEHAFFNFAQLLIYPVGDEHKKELITVRMTDVPANWKIVTPLPSVGGPDASGKTATYSLHAGSYDQLVDSPTELGTFEEKDFDEGGKHYRVIVHGRSGDYDIARMASECQRIVRAETDYMHEAPYEQYTFIYHVNATGGGGMEHSYSTAIGLRPLRTEDAWKGFESVTAHEFFHLWNVKRIRPQTLEPVDYSKEQYTRELWFSEGVTSTVAAYTQVRAGFSDEAQFRDEMARAIENFRQRPAHLWQSPQESSLDTWFDKYPYYSSPERSVSYYLSGELIGYLLDLEIRERSSGKKGLRDLFLDLNREFAHAGKYFSEEDLRRFSQALADGTDEKPFFAETDEGATDLPFEQLLPSVGWQLQHETKQIADAGFDLARNFDQGVRVGRIRSQAVQGAGLRAGDEIVAIEGAPLSRDTMRKIAAMQPGGMLHVTVRRGGTPVELMLPLGSRQDTVYSIVDAPNVTAQQRARRAAWLRQEDQQ